MDAEPSRAQYEGLLAFLYRSPMAIVQTGPDGDIELMSPRSATLLTTVSGGRGIDNLFDVLAPLLPDLRERVHAAAHVAGPVGATMHFPLGGSGSRRCALDLFRATDGRFLATLEDVTEALARASTERSHGERMSQLVGQLNDALDTMAIAVLREDLATRRCTPSARLRDWLGLGSSQSEMDCDEFERRVHPDDLATYAQDRQAACDGTAHGFRDFRLRLADGRWARIGGQRFRPGPQAGSPSVLTTFCIDVTEQRAAEREQLAQAEQLHMAASEIGVGTVELPAASRPWRWNAQSYRLHGCAPGDAGDPRHIVEALLEPQDRSRLLAWQRDVLDGHAVAGIDYPVSPGGAPPRWLRCIGRAHRDGGEASVIGIVWDVTEIRQVEQAEQARQRAEAADRAKTEFLSHMSHELRTPLNAVCGFTELMLRDPIDMPTAQQRVRLGHVRSAALHLLGLVDDLLELPRIEAGELALTMDGVDALPLMRDVAAQFATSTGRLGLAIDIEAAGLPSAIVLADRARLRQVLLNLVSNAVKYNRPGGRVVLRAERAPDGWRLSVEDTGLGMTPQQQGALFRPFDRLGREGSDIQGTGLGLVIVRGLVEAMGGHLAVRSEAGAGTTFTLELRPHDAVPSLPPTAESAEAMRPDVRGRVLCVDDDQASRDIVRSLMRLRPHIVLDLAGSGAEAVAAARRDPPDLLMLDLELPDGDGLDVLRALRAVRTHRLPCVVVSARARAADLARAAAHDIDGYITKPLDTRLVLQHVDRLVGEGDPAPARVGTLQAELKQRHGGRRVLVAEDDADTRELMADLLRHGGLEVDAASDGTQAVIRALEAPPDLVITDVAMPRLDGVDAAATILALGVDRRLPIVGVSGLVNEDVRARCVKAGMAELLGKPVDPAVLYGVLLHLLDDAAAARPD